VLRCRQRVKELRDSPIQFVSVLLATENSTDAIDIAPGPLPRLKLSAPSRVGLSTELLSNAGPSGGHIDEEVPTRIVMVLALDDLRRWQTSEGQRAAWILIYKCVDGTIAAFRW
jgi:hypothetical protein